MASAEPAIATPSDSSPDFSFAAAAIVFITLFGLITIINAFHVFKSKVWWMSILLLGQVIGWSGRLWSSKNVYSLDAFLIQQCALILSPCFYSAALYGSLGMLTRTLGAEHSRLRPNFYMLVFCLADLLALVVQAVGGAMAAIALENGKASETGTHIMVAGIALQLAAMLAFCALGYDFFRRAIRSPAYQERKTQPGVKLQRIVYGMVWAAFWILVRSVKCRAPFLLSFFFDYRCLYRMVELSQGWTGYLITHEPFFICLDAIPMVLCQAAFVIAFPPFCIPYEGSKAKVDAEMASPASTVVSDPESPQEKGPFTAAR
ncbi:BZ3500_MvSof-1268-A1-R1_Chr7-1g09143 [Microbotryum saponariae]|uniref:BZ3500_MvSof-1268-A1-R1_Chr7-1g09143 protein n=1 Tax=Microbotryum saponariae TaxID=289078 RepID=A0A2X0KW30_9BASI|nr:BZ3501_MvSof-1269-A2-R1_Chr7-1g08848 [Microbotryum saponariae]SDA02884.1 BZ3500_MvSof-1268-A1-R1_Chr7-1g09143 [Microbotryum saponariae]